MRKKGRKLAGTKEMGMEREAESERNKRRMAFVLPS
jgi:hypothetical protein